MYCKRIKPQIDVSQLFLNLYIVSKRALILILTFGQNKQGTCSELEQPGMLRDVYINIIFYADCHLRDKLDALERLEIHKNIFLERINTKIVWEISTKLLAFRLGRGEDIK